MFHEFVAIDDQMRTPGVDFDDSLIGYRVEGDLPGVTRLRVQIQSGLPKETALRLLAKVGLWLLQDGYSTTAPPCTDRCSFSGCDCTKCTGAKNQGR